MTIYVTDVNDNAPSFIDLPYSVDIAEVGIYRQTVWQQASQIIQPD